MGSLASDGGIDIFIHVTAMEAGCLKPAIGLRLAFDIETRRDGRLRAKDVKRA